MRNRTTVPPSLFPNNRPITPNWRYTVTMQFASSGYPTSCRVFAYGDPGGAMLAGIAYAEVAPFDDLNEVWETLAVEAMLASTEPELFGTTPERLVLLPGH